MGYLYIVKFFFFEMFRLFVSYCYVCYEFKIGKSFYIVFFCKIILKWFYSLVLVIVKMMNV